METSQPLSIESFSYSWLVNIKSSLESRGTSFRTSLDASDEANSFIEMDPTMPPSKRFSTNSQDFKFDSFPVSPSSLTLVHADQLISNGYLMPLFIDPVKKVQVLQPYEATEFTSSAISNASPIVKITDRPGKTECCLFRKSCRRLSRQILKKYLNFLRPFCRRIQGLGTSAKAEKIYGGSQSVKNWVYSSETPPRLSVAHSCDEWRRSCDSESSIYEAVLHCKRSIGNEN